MQPIDGEPRCVFWDSEVYVTYCMHIHTVQYVIVKTTPYVCTENTVRGD